MEQSSQKKARRVQIHFTIQDHTVLTHPRIRMNEVDTIIVDCNQKLSRESGLRGLLKITRRQQLFITKIEHNHKHIENKIFIKNRINPAKYRGVSQSNAAAQ